jgi:cytochrome c
MSPRTSMPSSPRRSRAGRLVAMIAAAGLVAVATPAVSGAGGAAAAPDEGRAGAPPKDGRFQKVVLNDHPGEPVSLAVLPDGRVLHTARTGEVRLHDPETGLNNIAAQVPVYQHDEEGLQGIALDPKFKQNRWVYLYYSPPGDSPVDDPLTPEVNEGDAPLTGKPATWKKYRGVVRLSRFKMGKSKLRLKTEQKIIDIPVDQGICCHVGGQIAFDNQGRLYLSTGDDSNPFESDGYAPLDDRAKRNPAFDARRTAGNTNDLRGKVLRIKPRANRPGYTIPRGNLFKPGTRKTRPEIYAMGLRNPFRFDVNPRTGDIYMADYSPDATKAKPRRGPAGHGRWMVIDEPGNYGWPFCVQPDIAYVDYDFRTEKPGKAFDCSGRIRNDSALNTGRTKLPPVERSEIWYSYDKSRLFPELGKGGIGPMGGPAYSFSKKSTSRTKWPAYYDGKVFMYEWTRDYVKAITLGRGNQVRKIEPVIGSMTFDNPMDMEFGPDGSLYVLEYGDGYFAENPEAQLARVDFVRGNRTPKPKVKASRTNGLPPFKVRFSSAGTKDADGDRLKYAWDFDADGTVDSMAKNPSFTYEENGVFDATLRVTDRTGRSASAAVEVTIGNTKPVVKFVTPVKGQEFAFGDRVEFEIEVTDDTEVDCSRVSVSYVLGHDEHGHPITSTTGCSGSIKTSVDSGHSGEANLRGVFTATYTDVPSDPDLPSLSGSAEVVLEPSN